MIIIVGSIVVIVVMMLMGHIITIGEKIAQWTNRQYMEYVFYALVGVCMFMLLVWPVIRIHITPQMPALNEEKITSEKELAVFAHSLVKNCSHIPKGKRERYISDFRDKISLSYGNPSKMRAIVKDDLQKRMEGDPALGIIGVDQIIKEWGKTAFMVTAISQNSKLDAIGMLFLNYRMVTNIIKASGFRPTNSQLFRMYVRILTTAFLTYCISEALAETDDLIPFDFGDMAGGTDDEGSVMAAALDTIGKVVDLVPDIVKKSILDGTANLLMTLRIGYVTRAYLTEGSNQFSTLNNRVKIKRRAMYCAITNAPSLVCSGSIQVVERSKSLFDQIQDEVENDLREKTRNMFSIHGIIDSILSRIKKLDANS